MTLFICTAGTSVAGGPMKPGERADEYRARIETKLLKTRSEDRTTEGFLIRASAETHGIVRAQLGSDDEVVFLTSETEDGRICGSRLTTLVERELDCNARSVEVKGLQVHDGRLLRRVGINSLFDTIEGLTRDRAIDEVRLNATGGYKGIIPYVVLYGMTQGIPVSYVYEFSETLITLPALPLEFDWERITSAQEAILVLSLEGAVEEARWRELLPPDYETNRDRYDTLFEFEDGLVTLSVVGLLAKRRLDSIESEAEILLSPQAYAALTNAGGEAKQHFDAVLARIRNPLHRAGYKHSESLRKTDLRVWKVYGSGGPRVLYWLEDGCVHVGELFAQHDEYESYVNGNPLKKADYDRGGFVEIECKGSDNRAILGHIRRLREEPATRARALEDEVRALRIETQKAQAERNALKRSMHEEKRAAAEHAAQKAEREVRSALDSAYGKRLRAKAQEIAELEELIDGLRRDLLQAKTFDDEKE